MSDLTKLKFLGLSRRWSNGAARYARRWHVCLALAVVSVAFGLDSTRAQNVIVFRSLASFNGTNGYAPMAPLVQATDGNFYSTTAYGGDYDSGTVFQFTTNRVINTLVALDGDSG